MRSGNGSSPSDESRGCRPHAPTSGRVESFSRDHQLSEVSAVLEGGVRGLGDKNMVDRMVWTSATWSAALAALHSRSSVTELLSLYEEGSVSSLEILNAVCEHCYDKPAV